MKATDSAEKVFWSDFSFQELFANDDLIGIDKGDIHFSIKGSFSGEDSPQIGVIVLNISFLPGGVWFAVKAPCPAFFGHGTELNGHRAGKLGTIVRQDHGK